MRYALNVETLNGYATYYLSGVAAVTVGATGFTQTQVAVASIAALVEMQASASVKKARSLSGIASMGVAASSQNPRFAKPVLMQPANIGLSASHGIPNPMPTPDQFYLGLERNQVIVPQRDSTIVVSAPDKTVPVLPVDRTIKVEAELS